MPFFAFVLTKILRLMHKISKDNLVRGADAVLGKSEYLIYPNKK